MSNSRDLNKSIEAIIELKRQNAPETLAARVAELWQACRDAAALERVSQTESPERWPWPESEIPLLGRV